MRGLLIIFAITVIIVPIATSLIFLDWVPLTWGATLFCYFLVYGTLKGYHDDRLKSPEPRMYVSNSDPTEYLRVVCTKYVIGIEPYDVYADGQHILDISRGTDVRVPIPKDTKKLGVLRDSKGNMECTISYESGKTLYIYCTDDLPVECRLQYVDDIPGEEEKHRAEYHRLLEAKQRVAKNTLMVGTPALVLLTAEVISLTLDFLT